MILTIAIIILLVCIFTDIDEMLFGFPIIISIAAGLVTYGILNVNPEILLWIKLVASLTSAIIIMCVYRYARKTNSTNLND